SKTTITAVWSDEYLDLNRFDPRSPASREGTVHPVELEIPICQGCSRVSRLSGSDREENQHSILYRSGQPISELIRYYVRNMGRYGWQTEPVVKSMNEMLERDLMPSKAAQFRTYRKDDLSLTMIAYYDHTTQSTYVKIITS